MVRYTQGYDPRLLGGKFTTPEQLLANPGALRARQEAVASGFVGGSGPGGWGGGNYRRYIEQRQTLPQPIRPGPGLPIRPDRPNMPPSIPGPRPISGPIGPIPPRNPNDVGPRDQNLLGGNFTTFEQLDANPGALEARRLALRRGFPGGDSWGGGNYRKYLEATEGQRPIDDWPVEDSWPNAPSPPEGGWPPFPRPPEGGPVAHAMGTYPGQDPIARYYAMPGATAWPGDPRQDPGLTQPQEAQGSLMSPSYAPPVEGSFDPNLLGGNYATQAALEANPTALANRQVGLEAGFSGGEDWGQGRYAQWQQGQGQPEGLMAPMQEMAPKQGGFTNLGQGQQYLEGLRQLKRGQ